MQALPSAQNASDAFQTLLDQLNQARRELQDEKLHTLKQLSDAEGLTGTAQRRLEV